jgi:hypothetical protein
MDALVKNIDQFLGLQKEVYIQKEGWHLIVNSLFICFIRKNIRGIQRVIRTGGIIQSGLNEGLSEKLKIVVVLYSSILAHLL